MGDFIARNGNMIDYIDNYDEDKHPPPRFKKNLKINTKQKLLIDLSKTAERVLVNGLVSIRKRLQMHNALGGKYNRPTHC